MVIPTRLYDNERTQNKIKVLLESLGLSHNTLENYILAFVHRSFVNEKADVINEHNERLEFLGDAVLELVITNKLFLEFPKKPE
jgi:ribonuclease-3